MWIEIITFSILAVGISAPFHLNVIDLGKPDENNALQNFMYSFHGLGPFLSALICFFIFKKSHVKIITIFGGKPWVNLLSLFIILILGAVIGLDTTFIENKHLAGLYAVAFTMVYCFFEEFGWRGFLQDVLRPFPVTIKYFVIAIIWYSWHLSFVGASSISGQFIFFLILLVSSWAIGQAAERTKSVAIATYLHFIVNFLFLGGMFRSDFQSKVFITVPVILMVTLIIIYWPKIPAINRNVVRT